MLTYQDGLDVDVQNLRLLILKINSSQYILTLHPETHHQLLLLLSSSPF